MAQFSDIQLTFLKDVLSQLSWTIYIMFLFEVLEKFLEKIMKSFNFGDKAMGTDFNFSFDCPKTTINTRLDQGNEVGGSNTAVCTRKL